MLFEYLTDTSEVGVEPWGVAEKFVEEVQGVTLSKTVTQRDGVEIEFSVTNSRDFPIKVKIQVEVNCELWWIPKLSFRGFSQRQHQ